MTRILLSLPDSLLQDINTYCKTHHYNRSEFMRHAARLLVEKIEDKTYVQPITPAPITSVDAAVEGAVNS
jgi:metal-responsive CopG/Arc/MetJ family transcriptional regulator